MQGLQDSELPEQPPAEVPQEFKSTVTLGFAGFLIVAGIASLAFGGSLWSDGDAAPPASDAMVAGVSDGFVPSGGE